VASFWDWQGRSVTQTYVNVRFLSCPLDVTITTQGGQQIAAQGAAGATLLARAATGAPATGVIDIPNQADPVRLRVLLAPQGPQ